MILIKNIFEGWKKKQDTKKYTENLGSSLNYYTVNPARTKLSPGKGKTIISSIYNRIALDCSALDYTHCLVDSNERFISKKDSHLNYCLTVSANVDQTGRSFLQDVFLSVLDEGVVAIVPVEADFDVYESNTITDVSQIRVGKIIQWMPSMVKVELYNDKTGDHEEIVIDKSKVAIIENPFYSVMNEPNSTLQRLLRKIMLLDIVDEQTHSGKLDMIIQLPYVVHGDKKIKESEERRANIERQLSSNRYGVAYIDGAEKIIQLNRPVENNLLSQIESLFKTLYSQIGITEEVLNNTADERTMNNYFNRIIEVLAASFCNEMTRKYISKTAYTQGHRIMYHRDPFQLVSFSDIVELGEKFTRNEILSTNDVRAVLHIPPSDQPNADELRNKNLYPVGPDDESNNSYYEDQENQNEYDNDISYSDDDEPIADEDLDYENVCNDINNQLDVLESFINDSDHIQHYATEGYDPNEAHDKYMSTRVLKRPPPGQKGDAQYKNKYYDPEKAKEYYERTKKLKGRDIKNPNNGSPDVYNAESELAAKRSMGITGRNYNERGRNLAAQAKYTFNERKKYLIDQHKLDMQENIYNNNEAKKMFLDQIKEYRDSIIRNDNIATKIAIDEAKRIRKDQIRQHNNNIKNAIDTLRDSWKRVSKANRPTVMKEALNKISELREINESFKNKMSQEGYIERLDLQEKHNNVKNIENDKYRAASKSISNEVRKNNDDERSKHKSFVSNITKEFGDLYIAELDKISADKRNIKSKNSRKASSSKAKVNKGIIYLPGYGPNGKIK